jgi:hypothetical protein
MELWGFPLVVQFRLRQVEVYISDVATATVTQLMHAASESISHFQPGAPNTNNMFPTASVRTRCNATSSSISNTVNHNTSVINHSAQQIG